MPRILGDSSNNEAIAYLMESRGRRVTRRLTMSQISTINGQIPDKCPNELQFKPLSKSITTSSESGGKFQEKVKSSFNIQGSARINTRTRKSIDLHESRDLFKNNFDAPETTSRQSDLVTYERKNSEELVKARFCALDKTRQAREISKRRFLRSSVEDIKHNTRSSGIFGRGNQSNNGQILTSSRAKLMSRELKNLVDTNEFAKIDTVPVVYETWRNGKLDTSERPGKKRKLGNENVPSKFPVLIEKLHTIQGRKKKSWLIEGLYVGQNFGQCWSQYVPNKAIPLPMWHGKRILEIERDFKLPFDICSPLPPGQPKPDEWRKTTKNRFFGEASALWKVSKFSDSAYSKCVCRPETGCDEDCQNRLMFYECDDTNCALGPAKCTNRAFAGLQERRKVGGKYRIGVEVIKTDDRGYGVRSNRCFEPHQIIVEYTGEIITEEECDRRMNEDYKDNECYYLMSFDQSMIIDATKGSIARFVNHSCNPNCRMVKWIVGGNPRMALFAGDEPIMTGEELTYDYNFDPFSTKNIQECRCGSNNCRGVLGPRLKDPKVLKDVTKNPIQVPERTGKRKLEHDLDCNSSKDISSSKKRGLKSAIRTKNLSSLAIRDPIGIFKKGIANESAQPNRAGKRYLTNSTQLDTSEGQKTKISSGSPKITFGPQKSSSGRSSTKNKVQKLGRNSFKKSAVKTFRFAKRERNLGK